MNRAPTLSENARALAQEFAVTAGELDASGAFPGAWSGREPTKPNRGSTESFLLKTAVTENAIAVVDKALKLTGNHGVSRDNPLERHHRDALCARIHSPREDMTRIAAGRAALGI